MIEILCVVFRLDAFFDILLFAVGIPLGTDIVHPLFVHHFPEFGIGVRQGFPETDRFHCIRIFRKDIIPLLRPCNPRVTILLQWAAQGEFVPETMGLDRHRLDLSAMKQNGFLDNGESEPGAAKFPAAALVDAVETVEKPRETLFRNSGPVIGKGETPSMRFLPCRNFDGSPFGSIF